MRPRYKTPSIFSLSMVDMLCCALGCFILLWLVNLRDLKQRAREAGKTGQELASVRQDRDRLAAELSALQQDRDHLARDLATVHGERATLREEVRSWRVRLETAQGQFAATQKRLLSVEGQLRKADADLTKATAERDRSRKELADQNQALSDLQDRMSDAEDRLRKKNLAYDGMQKRMLDAGQRLMVLEAQVRDKDALIESVTKRERELADRLRDADKRVARLQTQADQVPGLEVDMKVYQNKYMAEEALARALEKDVNDKTQTMAALEKKLRETEAQRRKFEQALAASNEGLTEAGQQVRAMQAEAARVRAAAEARFAGVSLTGRRVVLLVDTSGSMDLINLKTPDPNKWPEVCQTVGRVLRSLPNVEKFQVIAFSEKVTYPLGGAQGWLDYDAKTSANRVVQALSTVKPEGGTNMHDALQAAFRFRATGMDTVYLFSDGLPNMGEGLPLNNPNLKESEKSEILGKVIRQTLRTEWNRSLAGQPRVRINAIGFFYESPEVGSFLWALTRENDGSFVGMSKP